MRKIFKITVLTLCLMLIFPFISQAKVIDSYSDLIENGKQLDKQEITIKGEAVGESMKRGDFTWVNICDGSTAIGIWMKNEDAKRINVYGNYKHKGDSIEVVGQFNRACAEHGGDMDVHAKKVTVLEEGRKYELKVNNTKRISAIVLTCITLACVGIYKYYNKKSA